MLILNLSFCVSCYALGGKTKQKKANKKEKRSNNQFFSWMISVSISFEISWFMILTNYDFFVFSDYTTLKKYASFYLDKLNKGIRTSLSFMHHISVLTFIGFLLNYLHQSKCTTLLRLKQIIFFCFKFKQLFNQNQPFCFLTGSFNREINNKSNQSLFISFFLNHVFLL